MRGLYGSHFPVEIRESLAEWLEQQPWADHRHDAVASQQLVYALTQQLQQVASISDASLSLQFHEAAVQFSQVPPQQLVGLVADLFTQEQAAMSEQQDQDALLNEMLQLDDPLGFVDGEDTKTFRMEILSALSQVRWHVPNER